MEKFEEEKYVFNGNDIIKKQPKKIKKLEEEKFNPNYITLYTIFILIWSVDFVTTIIALNLPRYKGVLYELNPLSAWFYQFGFIGWVGAFVYSVVTLFILAWCVCKLLNKLKSQNYKRTLYTAVIIIFVLLEGNAIFNNFFQLINNF